MEPVFLAHSVEQVCDLSPRTLQRSRQFKTYATNAIANRLKYYLTRNTLAKWQTWAQNPKHEIRRTQILQAKQIQNQNDQKQPVFKYP